jgi:hypothetical protein
MFQAGLFNWIGHGIVTLDHKDPLSSLLRTYLAFSFLHMCPCSQKSPQMMDGKRLSNHLSLSWLAHYVIAVSTTCQSQCPYFPCCFASSISHASKRLKTDIPQLVQDKGKTTASPSSPSYDSSKSVSSCMHLKDHCSHVINEIQP